MAFKVYSSDTPPGKISDFGGGTLPDGFLACDGTTYDSVANPKYAKLFSAIGTTYGGTGASSFKVPDIRGRGTIGDGAPSANNDSTFGATAGSTSLTRGKMVGGQGHQLSTSELASHQHGPGNLSGGTGSAGDHAHNYDQVQTNADASPGGGLTRITTIVSNANATTSNGAHTHGVGINAGATDFTGSGGSHNNVSPVLVVTKMIRY